jgi:hypothetical protein
VRDENGEQRTNRASTDSGGDNRKPKLSYLLTHFVSGFLGGVIGAVLMWLWRMTPNA